MNSQTTTFNTSSLTSNQVPISPPLAKKCKPNDSEFEATSMNYSLTTPPLTTLTTQRQQSGLLHTNNKQPKSGGPNSTTMGKTIEISTPIITTNNVIQHLNLANNLAQLPNYTPSTQQDLPMDTLSNAKVESQPKKSYAIAVRGPQQSKPRCKVSGHRDFQ
ncbi:14808_t:CDS:2 [Dentiscutata erythropus]|uniref:14808_t:CDS:1 n=1 Tax=Dentiscutata erythropus TaxID=1348616 RepID=A0A9N9CY09_9GLOM|nr:14808_t:CDS:2 [Dentiscutata erythropus]